MAYTLVLHVINSEPVVGEVEKLPSPEDRMIVLQNPRKMDGKDLNYLADNVTTVIWPVERLNFIEVLAGAEEEELISFVRE